MRVGFLIFLSALLTACGSGRERDEGRIIPPELEPLRETAFSCWQDSDLVPVEHSEHCVIVAETIMDDRREECDNSRSTDCLDYNLARNEIHTMYQMAIITSLLKFGPSKAVETDSENTISHIVYYDGELLREVFDLCLAEEQAALSKRGLKRVSSLIIRDLAEGQMCFREGYPDFEVEEI